jgi:hypothetical protein
VGDQNEAHALVRLLDVRSVVTEPPATFHKKYAGPHMLDLK